MSKLLRCCGARYRLTLARGVLVCFVIVVMAIVNHQYVPFSTGKDENSPVKETGDNGNDGATGKWTEFSLTAFRKGSASTEVERLAEQRIHNLTAECTRRGQLQPGWPHNLPSSLLVNDKLKTIYCMVGKVASSTWKKVFLVASGHLDPSRLNKTRDVKLGSRALKAFVPLSSFKGQAKQRRLDTYYRFMFVRHPMDRLTSTYLEKFRLMPKSIRPVAKRIIKQYRPNASPDLMSTGNNVTFEEFVRFLIDHGRQKVDVHWSAQSQLCRPCSMRYHFIGHYESMWSDADLLLNAIGVPDNLVNFPRWSKPRTSGNKYEEMLAAIDPQLVGKIRSFYADDYALFGYV